MLLKQWHPPRSRARAFIDLMGNVGHNCQLGASLLSSALESLVSGLSNLQLVGLVHENGLVLRNWRMKVPSLSWWSHPICVAGFC